MFKGIIAMGSYNPEALIDYYTISVLNENITISKMHTRNSGEGLLASISIPVSDIVSKEQLIGVYYTYNKKIIAVDADTVRFSSTGMNTADALTIDTEYREIMIYSDGVDYGIVVFGSAETNVECTIFNGPAQSFADPFCQLFGVEQIKSFDIRVNKRKMIANIDLGNSIAALEAQVDFLSNFVISLITANPEVAATLPGFERFKQVIEAGSVFTVKSEDIAMGDIQYQKTLIRNLQADYYRIKGEE
jgi:hypothetical protein